MTETIQNRMGAPTRPVMRYYGGKWRIAGSIVALMPAHDVYVEPFGGAGSVLLQKARSSCEVYNDLYTEVVNVFQVLRDRGPELLRLLELTPYARDEYVAAYESTLDPVESARRFIFRSTAGIGSNSSVKLNGFRTSICDVKHATAKSWANLPEALGSIVERLRGVIIENREAVKVMAQYDGPRTLHYVDPPYLAETRKACDRGYAHEMAAPAEHEALLDFVLTLKGQVLLSGYASALYEDRLKGWGRVILKGGRDQNNDRRGEVVWMNFEPPQGVML